MCPRSLIVGYVVPQVIAAQLCRKWSLDISLAVGVNEDLTETLGFCASIMIAKAAPIHGPTTLKAERRGSDKRY